MVVAIQRWMHFSKTTSARMWTMLMIYTRIAKSKASSSAWLAESVGPSTHLKITKLK
jgi:hypothetical protein